MKTRSSTIAIAAGLALALTACVGGGGPPKPSKRVVALIDRALATAPGEAQPSTIVATEVAYAQAATARGFFTAASEYAAPGAQMHGAIGPVSFAAVAGKLSDSDGAASWSPRTVVMSCDGALAASAGRFLDKQGFVGNYVTIWVRQADQSYKWVYDVAGRDDPQPPPGRQFEDGEIVVTSIDAITGLIASCARADAPIPPPPALSLATDIPGKAELASDGTLRWRWEHRPDGIKYVAVDYFYEGEWVTALEEGLASPREQ